MCITDDTSVRQFKHVLACVLNGKRLPLVKRNPSTAKTKEAIHWVFPSPTHPTSLQLILLIIFSRANLKKKKQVKERSRRHADYWLFSWGLPFLISCIVTYRLVSKLSCRIFPSLHSACWRLSSFVCISMPTNLPSPWGLPHSPHSYHLRL